MPIRGGIGLHEECHPVSTVDILLPGWDSSVVINLRIMAIIGQYSLVCVCLLVCVCVCVCVLTTVRLTARRFTEIRNIFYVKRILQMPEM